MVEMSRTTHYSNLVNCQKLLDAHTEILQISKCMVDPTFFFNFIKSIQKSILLFISAPEPKVHYCDHTLSVIRLSVRR